MSQQPIITDHRDTSRRRVPRMLVLIAVISIAPILASYGYFYWGGGRAKTNYGQLIATPLSVTLQNLQPLNDSAKQLQAHPAVWQYWHVAVGRCDQACQSTLVATRQVRATLGKDMGRVQRVLLVKDQLNLPANLQSEHGDLALFQLPTNLPSTLQAPEHFWLVDPLGNAVLQYADLPELKPLAKDILKLLKASRIG